MTSQPSTADSGHSTGSTSDPTHWWVVVVAALLLIGAGFLVAGLRGESNPMAGHPTSSTAAKNNAPSQAKTQLAVAAHSVPVSLRIPAIGVSVSLSSLGLNANGTAQVPSNYEEPGWYKLGPTPGQLGSAVILGHVDDKTGPAVFYKLKSLTSGDKVDVSLTDGAVVHFVVTTVESYLKAQFPSQKVYGSHGYSALQLVTCGGTFDSATGHYLSNVVAYTTLASTTPAGKQ
jgi:sortase (surface protein transpeptidase)